MWLNRNDRPSEACSSMNYICRMQKEEWFVVYLNNQTFLEKKGWYFKGMAAGVSDAEEGESDAIELDEDGWLVLKDIHEYYGAKLD